MFYTDQDIDQKNSYEKFLKTVGCLSNLYSDSQVPYLYYRVAEKMFCRAFEAEDLSRSDVSADAKKDVLGIGLKTFLANNNNTFQKVAEFNSDRLLYSTLEPLDLVKKVSELRNSRIQFTENLHGLEKSIYHCVIRDSGKFKIFEEEMNKIDIGSIRLIRHNGSSVVFEDGISEYSFLLSKSTLQKRFNTINTVFEFDVEILEDPIKDLANLFNEENLLMQNTSRIIQTVFLPLYGRNKTVFEKSGLNQWNAEGRDRHQNEAYIPIPVDVHNKYPHFFPDRDTTFSLKLPNGTNMNSKVCQENSKALMSQSNRELGKWILRDVLKLSEGELLTYEKLQALGIDSVRIDKISESEFEINFAKIGSYEKFIS